jgi:hypothetical protein
MSRNGFRWILGLWALTIIVTALAIGRYLDLNRAYEALLAENEALQANIITVQNPPDLSGNRLNQEDHLELQRLRAEVTQLRASAAAARDAVKAALENRYVATSLAADEAPPQEVAVNPLPAGNAQTPSADPLDFYRKNPELMRRYFPHLVKAQPQPAVAIDKPQDVAPQQNTATDNQQGTYDPLAFYRKNPELMKRYFPHLYRAELEQPQGAPGAPVQSEPSPAAGTLPPDPSPVPNE